jgi:tetratricopeptide (TPR) repeat protein
VTLIIILYFIFPDVIFPQCKKQFVVNQSVSLEGISNNADNYYQNLIIQDIAIASQQTFNTILLKFNYTICYVTDQCAPGLLDISVLPVQAKCVPLFYYGYDISNFIKPEKADLIFYLTRLDGFISDSLIFYNVPLEKDSSLYTSLKAAIDASDRSIPVVFGRAVFHYTLASYEIFRDRILQIDGYYAASLLADSTLLWASDGILSETGNKAEMILRQLEIGRIISYLRPEKFQSVYNGGENDFNGLTSRYQDLMRLNNRMKAIIQYNQFETTTLSRIIRKNDLLNNYLDRIDHYHQLAYKTDFRFVNFIDGIARPDFSNAGLLAIQLAFNQRPDAPRHLDRQLSGFLAQGLIDRGSSFELAGNQPRALAYYESAYELSKLMNLRNYQIKTTQLVGGMKNNIAASYLEISKKSALTENPSMAVQYFQDAVNISQDKVIVFPDNTMIRDYEEWLFLNFESQAVKCIELKNYSKALIYLNEIQSHCHSSLSYQCPELFHDWMRTTKEGIYKELLQKAQKLLASGELQKAQQVFRQAVEMRMRAGYRIEKDKSEDELESKFLQIRYDELIAEGQRQFDKEAYIDALYYFNKAYFQEKDIVSHPCPELFSYRQTAARQVMEGILSDGRLKAWAHDFEGADVALVQAKLMLSEYRFSESDTLSVQCIALDNSIHQNQCEKVFREFNDLMLNMEEAKGKNDFILALKLAVDAVNLSMENLGCRIRDDDAWYQKVLLEMPADFQQRELQLETLKGSSAAYLKAFQDLKEYYYRNKLLEQGVVFIPLYDRVVKSKDALFLTAMLGHYTELKEFDNALSILDRLRSLGYSPDLLAEQQKTVGEALARRDAKNPDSVEPWIKLESYTGREPWYREFGQSYKITWMKTTKWSSKYWPFIWKK